MGNSGEPAPKVLLLGLVITLIGSGILVYEFSATPPTVPASNFGSYSVGYSQGVLPVYLTFNVSPATSSIYLQFGFSLVGASNPRFFVVLPYEIQTLNAPQESLSDINVPGYGSILYGNASSTLEVAITCSGMTSYSLDGTHVFVLPVGNSVGVAIGNAKQNITFLNNVPFTNNFNVTMELYLPKYAEVQQTFPQLSNFEFFNSTTPGGTADQVLTWNDVRTSQTSIVELSATYVIPSQQQLAAVPDIVAGVLLGVGIPILIPEVAKIGRSKKPSRDLSPEVLGETAGSLESTPTLTRLSAVHELDSRVMVLDIMSAFPDIARYASPGLIFVGAVFSIFVGPRGLLLFAIGIGYLMLPSFWHPGREARALYPPLISGAVAVFIGALGLYAAIGVNASDVEIAGYYSLIAASFALLLAGVADLSLQLVRASLEDRIKELGKQIEDYRDEDSEKWEED